MTLALASGGTGSFPVHGRTRCPGRKMTNQMTNGDSVDNRQKTYSVAEAKARMSELLDRAQKGEKVVITRRGEPVVQLAPVRMVKPGIDFARLRALRATMPKAGTPAARLVRQMRDEKY